MKLAAASLLLLTLATGPAAVLAQDEPDERPAEVEAHELEDTRWSMVHPDGEFEGGCATGYMSLQLRQNGYFILNNRTAGAWTVDKAGRLRLRTKQNQIIVLGVSGPQIQLLQDLPSLRLRKQTVFQRCSE